MLTKRRGRPSIAFRYSSPAVCLLVTVLLASCQKSYDLSTEFTRVQLQEDFRVFRQSLEEAQPGLYRHTSKDEIDRAFSEAERSLDRPLDVFEFFRVLAPAVAAVRCGHTNIEPPDFFVAEQDSPSVKSFPVLVKIIDGRIYIWRDLARQNSGLGGSEILTINGVPAAQVVSTMMASTGGDGNIQTSRIRRTEGWDFIRKLMPLAGLRPPFELTVADSNSGRSRRVHFDGVDIPTLGRNWETWFPQDRTAARSGELEFIDGGSVARMAVREFGGFTDDERKRGLGEFFQDAFRQMAVNGTRVLILDLRNNGGGDDRLGTLLLSHLLGRPFEHYRDVVAKKSSFALGEGVFGTTRVRLPYKAELREDALYHVTGYPNLGVLQPSAPTFSGKIFVLINGGSFSTAAEVSSQLRSHGRAEFIGQEAGGAYDGNNSGTIARVVLPNTRLVLQVPLMSYYLAVQGGGDNSRGVRPDYPVAYSIDDYLSVTDKEMALAVEMARRESTTSGPPGRE